MKWVAAFFTPLSLLLIGAVMGPIYEEPGDDVYFLAMSADQDPVSAGDTVDFDTLVLGTDDSVSVSPTGIVTISQPGIYEFTATIAAVVNSNSCNNYQWFEGGTVAFGRVAAVGVVGGGNNTDTLFQPVAYGLRVIAQSDVPYTVAIEAVACPSAGFGDVAIAADASWVEIVRFN